MDKFEIKGGRRLEGEVEISGAKNAVLPLMAAALLCDGTSEIENVPDLKDVDSMCSMIRCLGAEVGHTDHKLVIDSSGINNFDAPYDLVRKMRASVYVLGPLLAKFGTAKVSLPGGCAWGPRPIDLHLSGFEKLGAKIELESGYILAHADKLKGAEIQFAKSSVGATGNVLMAAVLAEGVSVLKNCAIEPEITCLAESLVKMGAKIEGVGETELKITGVSSLSPLKTEVIPDRIETGTFLAAAAMTGGKITLKNTRRDLVEAIIAILEKSGSKIEHTKNTVSLESDGVIKAVDAVTEVYPGFPTDMQAQWIALMSVADGNSVIEDTIYLDRFTHVAELIRLGADISIENNIAKVRGVKSLKGAPVMSTDLRASASLIIAGLRAKGTTDVLRIYHIDRGYEISTGTKVLYQLL